MNEMETPRCKPKTRNMGNHEYSITTIHHKDTNHTKIKMHKVDASQNHYNLSLHQKNYPVNDQQSK